VINPSTVEDQIQLGPEIEPGHGAAIRRCGETGKIVGYGTFTVAKDGQPIPERGELIRVGAEDDEDWRDVTTIYRSERSGPAQVATPEYREGYDRIFESKQKVGLA
jgi:hypothetical protein